ncbi:MAG: hypothetical protein SVR94_19820, partial [Pseudomonadota bacterium]|nr:hypothetical protein [Pseudomonadota bacterium]
IEIYEEIETSHILLKQFDGYPIAKNSLERFENIVYFFKQRMGLTNEIRLTGPKIRIYQIIHEN